MAGEGHGGANVSDASTILSARPVIRRPLPVRMWRESTWAVLADALAEAAACAREDDALEGQGGDEVRSEPTAER